MSKYFESYSFEVGSTDPHNNKTKYTFTGDNDYIKSVKQKPIEIQNTSSYQGWLITSKGYTNGVLKSTAEKMIATRTIKIESIVSNKLPKFRKIELEEYDPYNPTSDVISFIESYDQQGKTDPNFTKIDENSERPYERKYANSSIISISQFLRDPEFEKMLPKVGDE
jgi:hypothetical protein